MQEADERDWNELEARYREECAALLGDARRHLEQRVAGEQAKIENALAGFSRDFDAWLARERRGEASPKPNLSTLFEIWLERAPRSSDAAAERAKRRAAEAEAEALRDRLGAETARAEELERRLREAEAAVPPPAPRRGRTPGVVAVLLAAALGAMLAAAAFAPRLADSRRTADAPTQQAAETPTPPAAEEARAEAPAEAPTPPAPSPAPAAAPEPERTAAFRLAFDNRDIAGAQIAALRNVDQPGCLAACRRRADCRAYVFDKWNHACRLKADAIAFTLNPRATSGLRDDSPLPRAPAGPIAMERYPSRAFPGEGYRIDASEGPQACEALCRDDAVCVAFTFRLDEGVCHLFATTGEYFPNALADSGGKRQN
ncbi:hypothetical protein Ms3S1_09450 [Methylosinus sp. 3S-1]|uniref:Apple domain-containing protein n=4 Tax=Methylocystaceae TaxID=31993 RepID=A0A2D2CXA0_METT3|nr:hypothetical protein CQW49_04760 [Methylosinus trichosporium OB3b]